MLNDILGSVVMKKPGRAFSFFGADKEGGCRRRPLVSGL